LVNDREWPVGLAWEGTLADLHDMLGAQVPRPARWPRDVAAFGRRLTEAARELEDEGIAVERTRSATQRRVAVVVTAPRP